MHSIWISREDELKQLNRESWGLEIREHLKIPIPSLVERFLWARGILDPGEIQDLLSPQMSRLKSPLLLTGVDVAIDRLTLALLRQERICIYGDFDLDGTSGICLLVDGLKQLGYSQISWFQPRRLKEGYGFHAQSVEELYNRQGVTLILTVDVGITGFEACLRAQDLGLDVIITDHHQQGPDTPEALAVINPNQKKCKSGLTYLSGAGVAFYLLRALKRHLLDRNLIREDQLNLRSLLDCFTLSTISDMVPLVEDNRTLVKHGLIHLQRTQRPGLRALLEELDLLAHPLTGQDVGMKLAPKLNALSRMEDTVLPLDVLLSQDEIQARSYIKVVMDQNQSRAHHQQRGEVEALRLLQDWPHKGFVLVSSPTFHRGVVGLIATRLSQHFSLPAFVGSETPEGQVIGSARIPDRQKKTGDLLQILGKAQDLLIRFGGHPAAAGFEYKKEVEPLLIQRFSSPGRLQDSLPGSDQPLEELQLEGEEDLENNFNPYDLDLKLGEINETTLRWMDHLGPFGVQFPPPLFRTPPLEVRSIKTLRGGHKKLILETLEALYFSPPKDFQDPDWLGQRVEALVEIQWNSFLGRRSVQVLVRHLQKLLPQES